MNRYFIIGSLLLLAACMSAGVKIDQSKLSTMQKGKTTYDEVVQAFGKPTQVYNNDNGTMAISYSYVSAQPRPESFIPIAGAFVGGADTENSTVTFNFNHAGILQGYTSSHGSAGAGTGFEAISQPRNDAQPGIVK